VPCRAVIGTTVARVERMPAVSLASNDILHAAVAAAVLAPSSHNTQPWRFRVVGDDTLHMFADESRRLRVIDPDRRQLVQSCGCALYNARVAVRANGIRDEVTVVLVDRDQPDHLATLSLRGNIVTSNDDVDRMAAIPRRHTNRREFLLRPIAACHTDAMATDAALEGATLVRILPSQKAAIAHLIDSADRLQLDDPAFRDELGRWLAPPGSSRRDGIPFAEKEYGSSWPLAKLRALRSPQLASAFGQLEEERTLESPAIVVIGTKTDEPPDWLACGQALQAVLLRATTLGFSASFLNQVLEIPELRGRVAEIVPEVGYPQMVLRIGVATAPVRHPAPRRKLEDVLETAAFAATTGSH
jgi:hypothetical protein